MTASASEKQQVRPSTSMVIRPAEEIRPQCQTVCKRIAERAYHTFEARSHEHGSDLEDWLRAEAELLEPVVVVVSDSGDTTEVEAELSGTDAQNVELGIDVHNRLILVSSQAAGQGSREGASPMGKWIYREIELAAEVDASRATAVFSNGRLHVVLPKRVT